jgi:hypothetical protein
MTRLTLFLLLLSPIFIHAQKRLNLNHINAFAFYDYNEKAFCVLDDSTFLWKYNQQAVKWEKKPVQLTIEMPFEQFLADFIPMSEKGTPVYFVYRGCGVVYSLQNSTIKRHDHSFYHMNQFDGAFFMDEGEPRIYGGYGLFTSKNIITRYDTIEREWFLIYSNSNPSPVGIKNILQKHKNHYYVFDGFKGVSLHYKKFDELWQFNTITNKWIKLGKINQSIIGKQLEFNNEHVQIQNNMYACFQNMIISYDLKKLRFKKYKFYSTGMYREIINVNNLILVFKTNSKPKSYVEITNSDFLNNLELEEGDILLKDPSLFDQFRWQIGFFVLLLGILIVTLVTKYSKRKKLLDSNIEQASDALFDEFNSTEIELIQLLIQFHETGLEISHINDLVNHDQPSIDTLKKRRETLLKELRYKLAAKFNIPQEEIFVEERMKADKRMKLLFLNKTVLAEFSTTK